MSCDKLTIGATALVILDELADNSNAGAFVNGATVTGVLYEADRTTAIGSPFSLSYVAGSNGKYQGTIAHTVTATLTNGTTYYVEATAVESGNYLPKWLAFSAGY